MGNRNISPVAVENALQRISPDIEQVHVVAVPDERYGEEAGAVISWKDGISVDAAKRQLKTALLLGSPYISAYETPKYIASLPVSELPMTSTGKVQRSVLKTQLPYERFESIYGLSKSPEYRFTVLHRYSRWSAPSYELHKKCWGDIAGTSDKYEKSIGRQLTILAVRSDDSLAGQIAIVRSNLSETELLAKKYDELASEAFDRAGNALVFISICSADYKPKPIPSVEKIPSPEEVRTYISESHDPVMKFHQKRKGGQSEGAKLIDVIERGRPKDASSLGYTMLLKYPEPIGDIQLTEGAPISNQLIEVVLLLAHDLGIKNVYAYSRPGALAAHLSTRAGAAVRSGRFKL